MGALKKQKNKYFNTHETHKHFCEDSPHYKRGHVMLRKTNRDEWSGLMKVIREGRNFPEFEGEDDPEFRREFTYAMHERSQLYAPQIAEFVTRKPVGYLLDLGGGPGSYSLEILKHEQQARAMIVDRPATLESAKEIIATQKAGTRIEMTAGDIFELDHKQTFDTVLFSNILHIYSTKENKILLKKIHRALKPSGRLILVDLFLDENETSPIDAAFFSLTMLMFTKTGKSYTFSETEKVLTATGFTKFKRFPLTHGSSILECSRK
jgi:ubiquinone/menaquinone biosynthesis C-methylase UbiE